MATEGPRRCTNCGRRLGPSESYELWLFQTCPSCVAEPAPARWSAGMAPGTSVKWSYTPRWHLDTHGESNGHIVAMEP
jgi:hypothetical protein